jgi:predicted ester cyclase
MSAENKVVLRRFYEEFWNGGNPDAADELLHPDYVDHQPVPGATPGIEGFKELVAEWHKGFPDMSETIEDLIAEGDKVVGRFTFRGTHTGEFFGIAPTGLKAEMVGIDICRIVDGRIKEFWYSEQLMDLYRQLGVLRLGE